MNGNREQVGRSDLAAAVPMVGEVHELVSELIMSISEAKSIPASGRVMVDREQTLQTLERLQDRLPEEMRAARWMVKERRTFVARTNERGRELVNRARQKADELISETNIIAQATEEANILVRRAEDHAHRIRLEAEDYAEDRLERLESLMVRVLDQIRSMRAELRQTRATGGHH